MRILKYTALFLGLAGVWSVAALLLAFEGWWMKPVAAEGDVAAFRAWMVNELEQDHRGSAAFILIENGEAAHQYFAPAGLTDGDTLFPTASFSKFITALAVIGLHEQGKVDLDSPVSRYLTRWELPASGFDHNGVTVRRLLSHTAGLTDGLGFGDYDAEEELPTTVESLRSPRASTGVREIRVTEEPGSGYAYSGGGYLILQLMVEEVTQQPFADYVKGDLLDPLDMNRSTYAFYASQANATLSYDLDGEPVPASQYASPAATGFNSSADDLTRLARALLNEKSPLASRISLLQEPGASSLGADFWGLGSILYAPVGSGAFVFGHDGRNDPAINTTLRINPVTGDAIIGLVSGHLSIASRIGAEWVFWQTGVPDVLAVDKVIDSAIFPALGGILVLLLGVIVVARRNLLKS